MIVSHKHQLMFIHCRKTAGSSVAVSLSRYLGPKDIQLSAIEESLQNGIRPPRRMMKDAVFAGLSSKIVWDYLRNKRTLHEALSLATKKRWKRRVARQPQHASAQQMRDAFPLEWASYFKFCVVRNPWDKTVSDYFWRMQGHTNPPSFGDYVASLVGKKDFGRVIPRNHDNWHMYAIDDEVAVDYVVKYEDLHNGLRKAFEFAGLTWDGWLPHSKAGKKDKAGKSYGYREYYDDEAINIVHELYRREIDEFGYVF